MFIAALFTVAKIWNQPKCPTTDQTTVLKSCGSGEEILPFATAWMDLQGIMLSEISQSKKEKYHMSLLKFRI